MSATPAAAPIRRDLRVDFIRGIALYLIFIHHFCLMTQWSTDHGFMIPSLTHFGYAASAEIFVFLAGYTIGLVYQPTLVSHGFGLTFMRAAKRAFEIYSVNLLIFVLALALAGYFFADNAAALSHLKLEGFAERPYEGLARFAVMLFVPANLDILVLYVVMLPLAPFMMLALRISPVLAFAISIGVYLAAQSFHWLNLPASLVPGKAGWPFNPFAWQLIFFLGVVFGQRQWLARGVDLVARPWRYVALGLIGAVVVYKLVFYGATYFGLFGLEMRHLPYTNKMALEPLRLVNFAALMLVLLWIVPASEKLAQHRWATATIRTGQNSLAVFAFGVVADYLLGGLFAQLAPELVKAGWIALGLGFTVAGLIAMIGFAYLVTWLDSKPWAARRAKPAAS